MLARGKKIKSGLEIYFDKKGKILHSVIEDNEQFDGFSCIFTTKKISKEEMVRLYFDKDVVEKAFRCIKGITQLRPIRHWLYNRVIAHVMICYLSYTIISFISVPHSINY